MLRTSELLSQAVRPDLYRINAFRVAQLHAGASPRELTRRLERIKMLAKLGGRSQEPGGPLPLQPAPDLETMREALERLRDPEVRLLDEFFWFWPESFAAAPEDAALTALARGDVASARKRWQEALEPAPQPIALHNLAVLAHLMALDLECRAMLSPQTLDGFTARLRDQSWATAYQHWTALVKQGDFWRLLKERIVQLAEPQLTPELADALRSELPMTLLGINAQLAVAAAARGQADEAHRHRELVCRSGFDELDVEQALRRALKPVRDRLKSLSESSSQTQADGWRTALELYQRVAGLPLGQSDRDTLLDDVAEVMNRVCWFCQTRVGESGTAAVVWLNSRMTRTKTANRESVHWHRYIVDVPRCWHCYQAHRSWDVARALGTLPRGVRPEKDKEAFPTIERLRAEGWEIGAIPAGA